MNVLKEGKRGRINKVEELDLKKSFVNSVGKRIAIIAITAVVYINEP